MSNRLAHGHRCEGRTTPTYYSWIGMKERCFYPKNKRYNRYGGRGITVCNEWVNSFEQFLADMGERPEGKTLDRIDTNGNYEPSNCRWATYREQANNKVNKRTAKIQSNFKGVYWHKRDKKWRAAIRNKGKSVHLGYFNNEEDAAKAYQKFIENMEEK